MPSGLKRRDHLTRHAELDLFVMFSSASAVLQASPDLEQPGSQAWNFECIGGSREETYPLFSFLVTHSMEGAQGHQVLKH